MTRPVQIAHAAPTIAGMVAVNSRHDLASGVIVVHPTPGHGGEGIARDVLQALGKQFRDRTPRDSQRLQTLAGVWLRAELTRELVIVGADHRPATDWRVLRDLCSETHARLTLVVERRPDRDQLATLRAADVRDLTVPELVQELPPATPPDTWGIFDESGTPDERPGYPPVPDVDFPYFPSACTDLLPEHDAARVLRAFERARALTMLWFELRRGFEPRHGPGPRHAHALLDALVAPCVTVDGAITMLRGAQAAFLLNGTLLEIDPDTVRRRSPRPRRLARNEHDRGDPAQLRRAAPRRRRRARIRDQSERQADRRADARLGRARRRDVRERPPDQPTVPGARRRAGSRASRRRRRHKRSAVPHARSDSGSDTTAHPQPARADRTRHRSALRHHHGMEPLHSPTLGNLPPARRPHHGLNDRPPSPAGRAHAQPAGLGEVVWDGQYRDAPGHPGRGPAFTLDRYRTADDRAVEAMLASLREPCTAAQLATGLEWTLTRTVDALEHLEAALANTGQTLTRIGQHQYTLQPRDGLLHDREIGRCLRHARDPLDLPAAAVLYRALTCSREDRARDALSSPAEHAAADRLIAARLLKDDHGFLRPTPLAEATFRAAPEPRYLRWTA